MILKWLYVNCMTAWFNYKIRKDDEMMAKVYFNRLILGTIVYESVPARYQESVKAYGVEWVKAGRMSVDEYEQMFHEEYEV